MDWQTLIIAGEAAALAIAAVIAGASRMRALAMTDRAREYRAAIGFARMQPQASVACRFLQLWQDGELTTRDPELFAAWMEFRSAHFRNLRPAS